MPAPSRLVSSQCWLAYLIGCHCFSGSAGVSCHARTNRFVDVGAGHWHGTVYRAAVVYYKKPIMVAWSTPGAAVLAAAGIAGGLNMAEAVGAFMVSAALITLCGVTGWFEKVMMRIPVAIASALLAGVLARFTMRGFTAAQTALPLVLLMLVVYLVGRR